MKFHIVGNNESIQDILNSYELTLDELKNENKHIRVWNYLIPGTKLKIPVLTEAMNEELNEMEPFIEDYYPKIKIEEESFEIISEEKEEININDFVENSNIDIDEDNKDEEVIEELGLEDDIANNNQKKELDNTENSEKVTEKIIYRYVYPNPHYRPIVYVIPRRKTFI